MPEIVLYVFCGVLLVALVLLFVFSAKQRRMIDSFKEDLSRKMADYHKENKDDYERAQTSQREEISARMKDFNTNMTEKVGLMNKMQEQRLKSMEDSQKERLSQLEKVQSGMIDSTSKSLESMRQTVEEKLDKTLNDRISKSFETVGNQLDSVKTGLAEMRDLAKDVGGLKKVLGNVKMRG